MAEYQTKVVAATRPLDTFNEKLIAELDEVNGAFPFWVGGSDWKTHALLADYLIQSISGTGAALESAALATINHSQYLYSHNTTARAAWLKRATTKRDDYFWKIAGSPEARRKNLQIDTEVEHCFFHLGQALDRLAAAVIIVGGFGFSDVSKAYHSTLDQLHRAITADKSKPTTIAGGETIAPHGSPGRDMQKALLQPMSQLSDYGPEGWLEWLRDTRNALTHRPAGKHVSIPQKDGAFIRPLYRNPQWSELQSFVFAASQPRKSRSKRNRPGTWVIESHLDSSSGDVLEGLLNSTCLYVAAFLDTIDACWEARKANPAAITQHGKQWPHIRPKNGPSPFVGYGKTPKVASPENMFLHPHDAKRLAAARATNPRIDEWFDDDPNN